MKNKKNWLEWTVFAWSFVIVIGTLGFLVRDAARTGDKPPILTTTTAPPKAAGDNWLVPVKIKNTGDTAAEEVLVEVQSGDEKSELTFLLVPRGSQREGFAVFSKEPKGEIESQVRGYETP